MKVSLLNDSFPPMIDGVVNVVLNYANHLQQDEQAKVMVGTPYYPEMDYSTFAYPVVTYPSFDTSEITNGYRAGNPFSMHEINELVQFKPDIIHTHCPMASTFLARMMRNALNVPIVFTYHTKFDVDIARALKGELLQKSSINAIVANISACDEVWTVSKGAGENLKSLGYEGEYRVMPNGVDFEPGKVDITTQYEITKNYDLPQGVPIFLFVGRLMKYKGIPLLLDALTRITDMDYRMVFIGEGVDREEIKKEAIATGIPVDLIQEDGSIKTYNQQQRLGKILFIGSIRDRDALRAWNSKANVFVFPSTFDTNGLVVREAAACGLPSILIEGSCAAEGISDGRNGFLVKEDSEAIKNKLIEISQDLNHLQIVGDHAMKEIYLSWQDCVHLAYQRYEEILEAQKAGILIPKQGFSTEKLFTMYEDVHRLEQTWNRIQEEMIDGMIDNVNETQHRMEMNLQAIRQSMKENMEGIQEDIHKVFFHNKD